MKIIDSDSNSLDCQKVKAATQKLLRTVIIAMMAKFILVCSVNAQTQIAVFDFRAGQGVSQNDAAIISATFRAHFVNQRMFTTVPRTLIDRVINEQGVQHTSLTNQQMVSLGQIMNVHKIVVGDVNKINGQLNVDARLLDVPTGTERAIESVQWAATSSSREWIADVATRLSRSNVETTTHASSAPIVLVTAAGNTLRVFPEDIGSFQSVPTAIIAEINSNAQYGFNNWRIPTNQELAFMRTHNASARLGLASGAYIASGAGGSATGNVRLVTTGISAAQQQQEQQQALENELAAIEMVFVAGNNAINNFYIGKYPVTQRLWRTVMGPRSSPSFSSQYNHPSIFRRGTLDNPVENVSWWQVQDFIRRLNELTGRNFRLPTEAEWEFAARGGNYSRGYRFSGSNNINEVAWYILNSNRRTHPVGMLKPNELGIHDMTGHVWEWTQCRERSNRVVRGGSLVDTAEHNCISFRHWQAPEYSFYTVGFRLAHPSN